MGVCSYCGEYAPEWEECFGWQEAIACSEKARKRRRKLEEQGARPRIITTKTNAESD
jgi:hypothetical protein